MLLLLLLLFFPETYAFLKLICGVIVIFSDAMSVQCIMLVLCTIVHIALI